MSRFCIYLWVLFLAVLVAGAARAQPRIDAVQVRSWLEPDTVAAGDTVHVLVSFKVREGIHVNEVPPLRLGIPDEIGLVLLKTRFEPDTTRKAKRTPAGYQILDVSKPLLFPAVVPKKTKPDRMTVPLKITYYYCSEKEGWCSFKTVEVPVSLVVRKR